MNMHTRRGQTSPKSSLSAYASGSANTIRPVSITHPNGRVITFDYGTGGPSPASAPRSTNDPDGVE